MEEPQVKEIKKDIEATDLEGAFRRFSTMDLIVVLDHARAGNNFFMRIFDQHSEVLSIPFIAYFYSHLISFFAGRDSVHGDEIYDWMLKDGNISKITSEIDEKITIGLKRCGDYSCNFDHRPVRDILAKLLKEKTKITYKQAIAAVHLSYALGTRRDINRIKYLLINDTPRNSVDASGDENKLLFDAIRIDNPKPRIIHLVRDPRPSFASIRYEYVNKLGNMYPIKTSMNMWKVAGCNSVWLWTLRYTTEGAKALFGLENSFGKDSFYRVRNEDLNINFQETMRLLTKWLGISWYERWSDLSYVPTSCGLPWQGMSAYSRANQPKTEPAMKINSKDKVLFAGPNREITEIWKKRLPAREIKILETVYYDEMQKLNYGFLYVKNRKDKFFALLWLFLPLAGEIPRLKWWVWGKRIKNKIAFIFMFVPGYILSRVMFFISYIKGEFRIEKGRK